MWYIKSSIFLCLALFVTKILCIYTPYDVKPRKPTLSPGIKTANWQRNPSENVLMHHNYSRVNYQNPNGNALSRAQIYKSTTKEFYPVYQPDGEKTTSQENITKIPQDNHQKLVIRVKKQLDIYDKCPPGAMGQYVYSLSCNQFLNCWKGRTFIQNCSPGTLFNPDTLSCDFPEKVRCVTGPRQTMYEEPPPSQSHNLNTRDAQQNCPTDFSGRIPNYSNCSKFIVCMDGQAMNEICPPGTLFDTNRNVCDFPKIAKCFNGQNQQAQGQNVDYFVVDALNQIEENVNFKPTTQTFHQTHYGTQNPQSFNPDNQNTNCDTRNGCPKPFATHPPVNGGTNCGPSNCGTAQNQGTICSNRNCGNPTYFNTNQQFQPSPKPPTNTNCPPTNCDIPNTNCDPSNPNCRRPSNGHSRQLNYDQNPEPSNVRINYQCQGSNCGGYANRGGQYSGQNTPNIGQFQPGGCPGGRNCVRFPGQQNQNYISQKQVECPSGASGVHPHPYDCSKFLNCANGQTFVQNCGSGTLFNPKIMNCDHDYNVDCINNKGVSEINDNYLTTTQRSTPWKNDDDSEEAKMTTSFTYLRPDPNLVQSTTRRGHYITRPPKPQNYRPNSDYDDIGSNRPGFATGKPIYPTENINQNLDNEYKRPKQPHKDKTWPPPFPATDTNADYVFEYYDADVEPNLDPQNAVQTFEVDCDKGGFDCNYLQKKCVSKNLVCDGKADCPSGKDEEKCDKHLEKFDVKRGTRLAVIEKERWDNTTATSCAYLCLESKKFDCKSFNYRNIDNCCLLSDMNEGMTGRLMAYHPNDYYELKSGKLDCSDMFRCNNNKCIKKSQICDGQSDCSDREDEKGCPAEKIGYQIRLNGGKNRWEGRVEVAAFGRIGYICDDRFDMRDANVVCRELGFNLGAAEVKGNSFFAQDVPLEKVFYMMDDIICQGNETSIKDCDFNGWGSHDCTNQEVVGVVCKAEQDKCPDGLWKCKTTNECVPMAFVCDGPEDCSDGSEETEELCAAPIRVRLINGTNKAEGRIEVKYHGVWGTVCDDDFNDDAAKVVCRNLGFRGTVTVKKEAYFGQGVGPIWLDQVTCFGNESQLEKCSHWNWGEHNCDHSEDVGVICSDSDTSNIERHVKKPQITSPITNTNTAYPIYPTSCGLRKDNLPISVQSDVHFRVVQGSKAKEGDFPWQAALRVKGKLHLAHWCGAVVIASNFVLTAAHCLVGYPKGAYVVVAGDYNVQIDEGTEQQAFIEDYYIHEDFRKGHKMNNDIALVKLKGTGLRLNEDVQAICLPDADTNYEIDLNCTISGFGSVESGTSAFSNDLRAGRVPLQSENVCKMPHVYGPSLTEGMFCAGTLDGGVDSCDGDSGGPLACLDEGRYTLYGITSWGQRCGYANKPGVYVKVAHYRNWIDDKMRKNV